MVKLKKDIHIENNICSTRKKCIRNYKAIEENENKDNKSIKSIYEFLVENSLDGELVKNERGGYDFISS